MKKLNTVVFLAGFPKCKTSSVTQFLAASHNLVLLDGLIEPHIFSDNKRITNLIDSIDVEHQYIDGSLSYIFDNNALANIANLVIRPIFVFALRNYSARFLSHWNYFFNLSEQYLTDISKIAPRMGPDAKACYIRDDEKILVERYLQSNSLDFERCSMLFLQHIIFENGCIDHNLFSQIEAQLKKGPTSLFKFELNRFLKTGSFLPYASILHFNYYWHNISSFISRVKAAGISKPMIYVIDEATNEISIPGFDTDKSIALPKLNASGYGRFAKLQIDSFFKDDELLKYDLVKIGAVTLL